MESMCDYPDVLSELIGPDRAAAVCNVFRETLKSLEDGGEPSRVLEEALSRDGGTVVASERLLGSLVSRFRGVGLSRDLLETAVLHGIAVAVDRKRPELREEWRSPRCPICGEEARLGYISAEDRRLYMKCGRCGFEWSAARAQCPYCGSSSVRYYAFNGAPWMRVYECSECGRAWIVVDEDAAREKGVRLPPRPFYYTLAMLALRGGEDAGGDGGGV